MPKHYIAAAIIIITLREHAGYVESVYTGQLQHRVCWSCVSGLEVVLISSGVDVLLRKLNSSSEEFKQQPITHQSPDHSMSYSLCTHLQCTCSTTWTGAHTTHVVPFIKYKHKYPHTHSPWCTHLHMHTLTCTEP